MKLTIAGLVLICAVAGSLFYGAAKPKPREAGYCASCHEMRGTADMWLGSAHRDVACSDCHGGAMQPGNVRRFVESMRDNTGEQIRLRQWSDLDAVVQRCAQCHREESAAWRSGPHAVTYAQIFTDQDHNRKRALMDDCFRCHGMHFQGSIGDMVTPAGQLVNPKWAGRTAIPCVACHHIHQPGQPAGPRERRPASAGSNQQVARSSLAFFDRRAQDHIALALLPLPQIREGERTVKMSPDQRQALCYQCHASIQGAQVGSGDDRTPVGVHEGISCLGCHQTHGQQTRASCATCHPKMSNCGLDVEKMDTTFRARASTHNIHFMKCLDCHAKGVPKRKIPV